MLLPLLLVLLAGAACPAYAVDNAQTSRWVREHFRLSGMNWVTPKMLREVIDKGTNTKPYMFMFVLRSEEGSRAVLDELVMRQAGVPGQLSQLSAQFVAVLAVDECMDEMKQDARFDFTGFGAWPRVFFTDAAGKVLNNITSPVDARPDRQLPYDYTSAQSIVHQMHLVLRWHQQQDISLAREAVRTPLAGNRGAVPASCQSGGAAQFTADLSADLPS